MVTRIHHIKEGVEYVLQYNIRSDTIELRIIKHTLIGGIPNYFRHEFGTYVREMDAFRDILRSTRTTAGINLLPYLTDTEKDAIHEFESIAGIHLRLTPESVSRSYQTAMRGAANRLQAAAESFRETARALQGLDLRPLIASTNILANQRLESLARSAAFNPPSQENAIDYGQRIRRELRHDLLLTGNLEERLSVPDPPPPTDEPPIPQEAPTLRNTEGLTEAQIQETEAFVARLLNGESIPATEFPLRDFQADTSPPDPDTTEIDAFLKELDAVLDDSTHETNEVWGAPTHTPFLDAETVIRLWKQANRTDNQPFRGQED